MSDALKRAKRRYYNKLKVYDACMRSEGYARIPVYLTPGMVRMLQLYEASFSKSWKGGEYDPTFISMWIERAVKRFFDQERERMEQSSDPGNKIILAIMSDPKHFKDVSGHETALLKTLLVLSKSEQESSEKGEQP